MPDFQKQCSEHSTMQIQKISIEYNMILEYGSMKLTIIDRRSANNCTKRVRDFFALPSLLSESNMNHHFG